MSTLGKVFLVLNLLVGGGFAYLAIQDWQGRQTIAAAGLRHVILLNGLPLGDLKADSTTGQPADPETMPTDAEAEIPFVVSGPGGKPTTTVSPALLKAYFAPAGGEKSGAGLATAEPVPNQLAEVRRVLAVVKTHVEGQEGDAKKLDETYKLLELQAETLDERQQFQALVKAGKAEELAARLYARFDRVLKPADPRTDTSAIDAPADAEEPKRTEERLDKAGAVREGPTKDEGERRARLAHLLVNLDPSAAWQKRVLMVVGARRYARTVAAQAVRLGDMAARVQHLVNDDQNKFVGEYATLQRLAIARTQRLRDVTDQEVRMAAEESRNADVVQSLTTQLDDPQVGLKAQLAQVKGDVSTLLAQQSLTEQELFAIQRQVAQTLDEIYRMEAALTNVERQRYSGKGGR